MSRTEFQVRGRDLKQATQPIPLFSKPLLIADLDDGTLQPSIIKEEFSTLVELVLRDESIERLLGNDQTNDIFENHHVLSGQNAICGLFFLWKVKQVALMIRPDHARMVRAILSAARPA